MPEKSKPNNSVPVLLYHGIAKNISSSQQSEGYEVTASDFAAQMIALQRNGYHSISMQEFIDYTLKGAPLPSKPILITFDDGIKDSYYYGQPILEALGMKASMFVIMDSSLNHPGKYYLNKDELINMVHSGNWDLEVHANKGHQMIKVDEKGDLGAFYSNKAWLESQNRMESEEEYRIRVSSDLQSGSELLSSITGVKPLAIAYPFGDIGDPSKNMPNARQIIFALSQPVYKLGFIQWWGSRGYSQSNNVDDSFFIKRITIKPTTTVPQLLGLLQSGSILTLPYTISKDNESHWISSWGTVNATDQTVNIESSKNTNGGSAFLDGTSNWTNYSSSMNVNLTSGDSAGLMARYIDNNNYIACSIDNNHITLRSKVNGIEAISASQQNPFHLKDNHRIEITVKDDAAECVIDDYVRLNGSISSAANHGGIGLTVYSSNGHASATVTNIKAAQST